MECLSCKLKAEEAINVREVCEEWIRFTFYVYALSVDMITFVSEYPSVNYRKYTTETNLHKQSLFPLSQSASTFA